MLVIYAVRFWIIFFCARTEAETSFMRRRVPGVGFVSSLGTLLAVHGCQPVVYAVVFQPGINGCVYNMSSGFLSFFGNSLLQALYL